MKKVKGRDRFWRKSDFKALTEFVKANGFTEKELTLMKKGRKKPYKKK